MPDLATFFKDYPGLVTALVGLIGIAIGFIGNGLLNRAKRRNELEDREFSRRAEIYDVRIQEARDTLENWSYTNSMMAGYASLTRQGEWNTVMQLLKDLPTLNTSQMIQNSNKWVSFDLLNDDELTNLRKEFFSITRTPMLGIPKVIDEFLEDNDFGKCQTKLQEYENALGKGTQLIKKMKARLDKLSSELK